MSGLDIRNAVAGVSVLVVLFVGVLVMMRGCP